MDNKAPIDLDAALEALARAERAAGPAVSEQLRARVLSDAADVAAGRQSVPAARLRPAGVGQPGLLGWLRGLDVWAGTAVAVALLCLVVGLGVGYGAGDTVLAGAGLGGDVRVAQMAEDDALFLSEDVL